MRGLMKFINAFIARRGIVGKVEARWHTAREREGEAEP